MESSISSQISTRFGDDNQQKDEAIAVWRKMAKFIVAHMKTGFFNRLANDVEMNGGNIKTTCSTSFESADSRSTKSNSSGTTNSAIESGKFGKKRPKNVVRNLLGKWRLERLILIYLKAFFSTEKLTKSTWIVFIAQFKIEIRFD